MDPTLQLFFLTRGRERLGSSRANAQRKADGLEKCAVGLATVWGRRSAQWNGCSGSGCVPIAYRVNLYLAGGTPSSLNAFIKSSFLALAH